MGLTLKQERFCQAYVANGGNATQAYRESHDASGMKDRTVNDTASKLSNRPDITHRIASIEKDAAIAAGITPEMIVAQYKRLAFFDARSAFDEEGNLKQMHQLDDDTAAAISGMEFEEVFEGGRGEREHVGRMHKIKLTDKRAALADLARIRGMFVDKTELTGKDGAPLGGVADVLRRREKRANV